MTTDLLARDSADLARRAATSAQAFLSFHARLTARMDAAAKRNPRTAGFHANPPVITVATAAPTGNWATSTPITAGTDGTNYAPFVAVTGATLSVSGTALQPYGIQRNATADGAFYQTCHRAVFDCDAPIFYIKLKEPQLTAYRLLIDGQYVDATGYTMAAANTDYWLKLDWSAATTPRQVRRYAIEMQGSSATSGGSRGFQTIGPVHLTKADTISAPLDLGPRVMFEGDSYTFGPVPSQVTTSMLGDGWAPIAADLLGIENPWLHATGGTGWLAPTSGTNPNILDRIGDVIAAAPDLLIINMGINEMLNDGGASASGGIAITPASTQARVTAYLAQLRASLPALPIVILGPFKTPALGTTLAQSYETAIFAGASALGDPLIATVPNQTSGAPLQTGTGYAGNATGNGNSDNYISSDQTHPTLAGHAYLGRRGAQMIRQGLGSLHAQVAAAYGVRAA